jgi:hypothetical protein
MQAMINFYWNFCCKVFEVKFGVDLLIEKYFYLNLIEGYKKISR